MIKLENDIKQEQAVKKLCKKFADAGIDIPIIIGDIKEKASDVFNITIDRSKLIKRFEKNMFVSFYIDGLGVACHKTSKDMVLIYHITETNSCQIDEFSLIFKDGKD